MMANKALTILRATGGLLLAASALLLLAQPASAQAQPCVPAEGCFPAGTLSLSR
jgi:hypothetical protein